MDKITFSKNWNNKLHCDFFSTIRLADDSRFVEGKILEAVLMDGDQEVFKRIVKIYSVSVTSTQAMTPAMAMIDTGMIIEKAKGMLHTMYKFKVKNIDEEKLHFIILGKP